MSLVEQLHAERKARLERMSKPGRAIDLEQFQIVEAKLSKAQDTIAELEGIIARQRKALQAFSDVGSAPTIDDVIAVVSKHFELSKHAIPGPGKSADLLLPRHIACFLGRQLGFSLHQIGRGVNRDHTTALYGANKVVGLAALDPELGELVQSLKAKIVNYACKRFEAGRGVFS